MSNQPTGQQSICLHHAIMAASEAESVKRSPSSWTIIALQGRDAHEDEDIDVHILAREVAQKWLEEHGEPELATAVSRPLKDGQLHIVAGQEGSPVMCLVVHLAEALKALPAAEAKYEAIMRARSQKDAN